MLVYVIAASVVLYFIDLFVFAGLNRKERARLLVCFILLVSAAFFWSAFDLSACTVRARDAFAL